MSDGAGETPADPCCPASSHAPPRGDRVARFLFFFFSRLSNHYYTIWVGFFFGLFGFSFLTRPIGSTFVNPKVTLKTKEFIKSKPFILPKLRRLLNSPSCNRIPLGIAGSARYSRLVILTT